MQDTIKRVKCKVSNVKDRVKRPPLDTIAQLPTKKKKQLPSIVKRARSKWYTQAILKELVFKESPLKKQYTRAWFCASVIERKYGKETSRYCNSKICNVCARIRTARLMGKYVKPLQDLGQLYFTTLTVPNVPKEQLRETCLKLIKTTTNVVRVIRERKLFKFSGIRKLEVTYNPTMDTYHPHIHLVHNEKIGELIIDEHLKRNTTSSILAQDTRKMNENDLNEVFKYATKFLIKDSNNKNQLNIYSFALDEIMIALNMVRTFQPFGEIRAKNNEDDENIEPELIAEIIKDIDFNDIDYFLWGQNDWISMNTGEVRSNYKPPEKLYIHYKKLIT